MKSILWDLKQQTCFTCTWNFKKNPEKVNLNVIFQSIHFKNCKDTVHLYGVSFWVKGRTFNSRFVTKSDKYRFLREIRKLIQNATESNRRHLISGLFARSTVYYGTPWAYKWDKPHTLYTAPRENYFPHTYYSSYNADPWTLVRFAQFLRPWNCPILLICLPIKKRMFSDENNFKTLKCILVFSYDCYTCIWKQRTLWQKEFHALLGTNPQLIALLKSTCSWQCL